MKFSIALLCLLVVICSAEGSKPVAFSDVRDNLRSNLPAILRKNRGRKTSSNIIDIAADLRDKIEDAIDNVSESKLKDVGKVAARQFKDIDDAFGLSDFFKKVSKAIDANIEFKNGPNTRYVYFF
ncbi:hypothetical protein RRG08_042217 [Elysia crispata]|uniref:Uncharacterized protein n=1 Tax=Elysia crispata TaxID=231223 RepID=A0AAE1B7T7_9GAST|nr:hypothetical protein RRG08_042217 [Elysia crispata]